MSDLKEIGLTAPLTKVKLAHLLSEKYPDFKWEKVFLLGGKYAQQVRLQKAVESLFAGQEAIINARSEAGLVNPATGEFLELDIYLPSLKLAFEFQVIHTASSSTKTCVMCVTEHFFLSCLVSGIGKASLRYCSLFIYSSGGSQRKRFNEIGGSLQARDHHHHCAILVGRHSFKVCPSPIVTLYVLLTGAN